MFKKIDFHKIQEEIQWAVMKWEMLHYSTFNELPKLIFMISILFLRMKTIILIDILWQQPSLSQK